VQPDPEQNHHKKRPAHVESVIVAFIMGRMRRQGLSLLLALGLVGCVGIPIHARSKKRPLTEAEKALPHEWVEIPADHGTILRGIFVPAKGPPVLLLYGSGMNIAGSSELIEMLHDAGYGVLCCDYRGTGYSSGSWWTSRFLDDDARALWSWMVREKGRPAGVFGLSIGSVAALGLLNLPDPPEAVVLDRPVDPNTVIQRYIGQTTKLGAFLLLFIVHPTTDVDLQKTLAQTKADTLAVLPAHDVLHPAGDVARMKKHLSSTVMVRTVPGGHLSAHLVDRVKWRSTILDFLDAHLRPGQPALGGRTVPADAAGVKRFHLDHRRLGVTLDRDELPAKLVLLLMGTKRNALQPVQRPARRMDFFLPRRTVRKLGRLLAVRAIPAKHGPVTYAIEAGGRRVAKGGPDDRSS